MKKLISLTAAIALMISIINISAFADTEASSMTNKVYYSAQAWLIDKYCDGEITYEDFQERSQSVTNQYVNSNTVGGVLQGGALNVSNTMNALAQKIGATVDRYGDEARGYISDWWSGVRSKNGVPTETTQTSNADMQGHGALCEKIIMNNGSIRIFEKYYCDYIVISYLNDNTLFSLMMYNTTRVITNGTSEYFGNYSYGWFDISKLGNYVYIGSGDSEAFFVYGDVRYQDGTPAPTHDEYTYGTIYNYNDMTERQLENLINDFSDKMTLENPDLSNMEGLLNAIYSRLGTLDSDDDNALLSAINAAIISLASDNNASNTEIIELLKELKDKKSEGSDLDPILKQLKEINNSLDYLKTINTLDLIGDTIDSLLDLTDNERTFLDTYATLILNLTSKLGYKPIAAMISSLEAVMFNGTPPDDIVISIYDTQVVLLSTSVFDNSEISSALSLAKVFVSVLLAISWLYSMRKKITGGA